MSKSIRMPFTSVLYHGGMGGCPALHTCIPRLRLYRYLTQDRNGTVSLVEFAKALEERDVNFRTGRHGVMERLKDKQEVALAAAEAAVDAVRDRAAADFG